MYSDVFDISASASLTYIYYFSLHDYTALWTMTVITSHTCSILLMLYYYLWRILWYVALFRCVCMCVCAFVFLYVCVASSRLRGHRICPAWPSYATCMTHITCYIITVMVYLLCGATFLTNIIIKNDLKTINYDNCKKQS